MSVTEAEFNRSTQNHSRPRPPHHYHHHGFVVSPVDPVTNEDEEDCGYGIRRVVSEYNVRRNSVTWDLPTRDKIPSLPFTRETQSQCVSSRGELPSPDRSRLDPTGQISKALGKSTLLKSKHLGQRSISGYTEEILTKSQKEQKKSLQKIITEKQPQPQYHFTTAELFERMMLSDTQANQPGYSGGYRDDYYLGDEVTSASHLVCKSTPERAIPSVDSLQTHDFAWIKRSNGSFTYAILAYRSCSSTNKAPIDEDDEEYMCFVLDDRGSTKLVRQKNWNKYVRLVCCKS